MQSFTDGVGLRILDSEGHCFDSMIAQLLNELIANQFTTSIKLTVHWPRISVSSHEELVSFQSWLGWSICHPEDDEVFQGHELHYIHLLVGCVSWTHTHSSASQASGGKGA